MFYIEEPQVSKEIGDFFLNYASISPVTLRDHLIKIRNEAWQQHNYPCLGRWGFLDFSIGRNPIYSEIVEQCRNKGKTVIDFGCCLGQDIRKLVYDGVPIDQVRGFDIDPLFIEIGYKLFLDGDQFREKNIFQVANIFDDQLIEKIPPADYVHVGSFIHLFDAETQRDVCKRLTRLAKCAIIGRQVGSTIPGEHVRSSDSTGKKMMRHSPESFTQMWNEVSEGRWHVEYVELKPAENSLTNARLLFVIRNKISQ